MSNPSNNSNLWPKLSDYYDQRHAELRTELQEMREEAIARGVPLALVQREYLEAEQARVTEDAAAMQAERDAAHEALLAERAARAARTVGVPVGAVADEASAPPTALTPAEQAAQQRDRRGRWRAWLAQHPLLYDGAGNVRVYHSDQPEDWYE